VLRHDGPMRADEFVTRRRPEWDRLEKLLARAGTGRIGGLRPTEVLSLAGLYRRATADLARAKRDWPTEPVAAYLNGLVARGHAAVYREAGMRSNGSLSSIDARCRRRIEPRPHT